MLAGDYIRKNEQAFKRMARAGLVNYKLLFYAEVNEWHVANGSSARGTAQHFGIPIPTVVYINQRMNQQIIADDLL